MFSLAGSQKELFLLSFKVCEIENEDKSYPLIVRLSGSSKKLKCSHPSVSTQRCWHSWKSAACVSDFEISKNVVSFEIFCDLHWIENQQKVTGICLTLYPFPSIQKNYLSHVYIGPLWLIVDVNLIMFKFSFKLSDVQNFILVVK